MIGTRRPKPPPIVSSAGYENARGPNTTCTSNYSNPGRWAESIRDPIKFLEVVRGGWRDVRQDYRDSTMATRPFAVSFAPGTWPLDGRTLIFKIAEHRHRCPWLHKSPENPALSEQRCPRQPEIPLTSVGRALAKGRNLGRLSHGFGATVIEKPAFASHDGVR